MERYTTREGNEVRVRPEQLEQALARLAQFEDMAQGLDQEQAEIAQRLEQLRSQGVTDLKSVKYAILETNGELSVFPFPANAPASAKDAGVQAKAQYLPVTVVSDGKILTGNLEKVGKDEKWLEKEIIGDEKASVSNFL